MKPTPFIEQVYQLMVDLLNAQGHEDIGKQLSATFDLPCQIHEGNPLIKKGLIKIIKEYVRNNDKFLNYYLSRPPLQDHTTPQNPAKSPRTRRSLSPKAEVKPHKTKVVSPSVNKAVSPKSSAQGKKSWMQKFEKPKTLEEINQAGERGPKVEVEEEVGKGGRKQRVKTKVQSSEYESEEDSFQLEPKKKPKKQKQKQQQEDEEQEEEQDKKEKKKDKKEQKKEKKQEKEKEKEKKGKKRENEVDQEQLQEEEPIQKKLAKPESNKHHSYPSEDNGPKKFFSRINAEEVGPIREELRDNSFQAKARFGQQADHWGQFGYEKLKDTRGDSFKKTKGKLKNRAFQGALMDINKINSIPIL